MIVMTMPSKGSLVQASLQKSLMQHGMLGNDSPGNPSFALHESSFAKLDSIITTGLSTMPACASFGIEDKHVSRSPVNIFLVPWQICVFECKTVLLSTESFNDKQRCLISRSLFCLHVCFVDCRSWLVLRALAAVQLMLQLCGSLYLSKLW